MGGGLGHGLGAVEARGMGCRGTKCFMAIWVYIGSSGFWGFRVRDRAVNPLPQQADLRKYPAQRKQPGHLKLLL